MKFDHFNGSGKVLCAQPKLSTTTHFALASQALGFTRGSRWMPLSGHKVIAGQGQGHHNRPPCWFSLIPLTQGHKVYETPYKVPGDLSPMSPSRHWAYCIMSMMVPFLCSQYTWYHRRTSFHLYIHTLLWWSDQHTGQMNPYAGKEKSTICTDLPSTLKEFHKNVYFFQSAIFQQWTLLKALYK